MIFAGLFFSIWHHSLFFSFLFCFCFHFPFCFGFRNSPSFRCCLFFFRFFSWDFGLDRLLSRDSDKIPARFKPLWHISEAGQPLMATHVFYSRETSHRRRWGGFMMTHLCACFFKSHVATGHHKYWTCVSLLGFAAQAITKRVNLAVDSAKNLFHESCWRGISQCWILISLKMMMWHLTSCNIYFTGRWHGIWFHRVLVSRRMMTWHLTPWNLYFAMMLTCTWLQRNFTWHLMPGILFPERWWHGIWLCEVYSCGGVDVALDPVEFKFPEGADMVLNLAEQSRILWGIMVTLRTGPCHHEIIQQNGFRPKQKPWQSSKVKETRTWVSAGNMPAFAGWLQLGRGRHYCRIPGCDYPSQYDWRRSKSPDFPTR